MKKILVIDIIIASVFFSCSKEEVTSRTYPRVQTESVGTINADGALLKGEITFSKIQIIDHGFLWSSESFPEIDKAEKISLGAKVGAGKFEVLANRNLQAGKTYSIRAYARSASNLVYGQVQEFVSQGCKNKPVISDFTPKQGTIEDIVTIQGDFFSTVLENSVVNFGELKVDILSASQDKIKIRIPTTTNTGSVNITVTSNGNKVTSTEKFILKGVRIDDFTPKLAVIASTLVQITGADLGTDKAILKVKFADKICEIVELTDARVVIKLPPDAPVGTFPLVVEREGKINNSSVNLTSVSPWTLLTTIFDTETTRGSVFVANDKAYFRMNVHTLNGCCDFQFWEYTMATNSLIRKANFISSNMDDMLSFSIEGKGYLVNMSNYEYDLSSNSWQSLVYPTIDVSRSIGFVTNGIGYAVGGNLQSSVGIFDPSTANWNQINPIFPIDQLGGLSGFIINNVIYIGLGWTSSYAINQKFWRYDITSNTWSDMKAFPGEPRANAISFELNGKGYVGGGSTTSIFRYDFWEYNPVADKWTRLADLPPTLKAKNGFSNAGKGYIASGYSFDLTLWSYDPNK